MSAKPVPECGAASATNSRDRSGQITDPFGHVWTLSPRIEDVSTEEMTRRFNDSFASQTD